MFANDTGDDRGFHIFDTDTLETEEIRNPYRLFHTIYYNDDDHQPFDARQFKDKIVKLFVKKRTSQLEYDKFLDKLVKAGIIDLKVVENTEINDLEVDLDGESVEDTLTLLNKYIEESDFELKKDRVKKLLREVYLEACEVE